MALRKPTKWVKSHFPNLAKHTTTGSDSYPTPDSTPAKSSTRSTESKILVLDSHATEQNSEAMRADAEGTTEEGNVTDSHDLATMRNTMQNQEHSTTPLTAANLATLTARDFDVDGSVSDLTSVSNISGLQPDSYDTCIYTAPYSPSHLLPRMGKPPRTTAQEKGHVSTVISTLEYDTNTSDDPHWLINLSKPLPGPPLNDEQNAAVAQRFYLDEIARLEKLRPGKEWVFEHFGETKAVENVGGGMAKTVYARGVWRRMVDGKVRGQVFDEWPVDWEGKPLGWGIDEGYAADQGGIGSKERDEKVFEMDSDDGSADMDLGTDDEDSEDL